MANRSGALSVARVGVLVLAATRIARLTTTDWLGEWVYVAPIKRWAGRAEREAVEAKVAVYQQEAAEKPNVVRTYGLRDGSTSDSPLEFVLDGYDESRPWTWQGKLAKGLDCGYCLTPWLMGGLFIAEALTMRGLAPFRLARPVFRWLTATLAASYVAGHIWNRLDND